MVKKIVYYWNILRTKVVEYYWNSASRNSTIDGLCLVFHHVNPNHVDTPKTCQCTTDSFVKIVEGIQEKGYSIISLDELQTVINQNSGKKFAIITFDDVPNDMYEHAYPYLREKGIPFTAFITTSFIDQPGYLSTEQLQVLNEEPLCTIGAHTKTHPLLRFNSDKLSEIAIGGDDLEQIIGKKIEYFAYPFGSLFSTDHNSIRIANSRYKYSFSTIDSDLNDYTIKKKGFLPRRAISDIKELFK